MVISRCNISHDRSQYIKRSTHADCLLQFHICFNLIQWHMPRAFYHHLHIFCPCTFCQFSQTHQLFNLAHVTRIGQTARTACIPKRNCNIIFPADFKNLIKVFVKWIFISSHTHPRKHKRSASGYNIHFSFMLLDLFNCLSCNSTMQCDKIHSILCVESYYINKIFCRQCGKISLIMNHTIINRNGSDHRRTFLCQFSSKWLRIPMRRKVHNCLCSHIYRRHDFFHLNLIIFAIF